MKKLLKMVRYSTGEVRVEDRQSMTCSAWLHPSDQAADLCDYSLNFEIGLGEPEPEAVLRESGIDGDPIAEIDAIFDLEDLDSEDASLRQALLENFKFVRIGSVEQALEWFGTLGLEDVAKFDATAPSYSRHFGDDGGREWMLSHEDYSGVFCGGDFAVVERMDCWLDEMRRLSLPIRHEDENTLVQVLLCEQSIWEQAFALRVKELEGEAL